MPKDKETVQSLILARLEKIEDKLDMVIPELTGLKTKAAVAGGIAGIIGTAIVTAVVTAFKFH